MKFKLLMFVFVFGAVFNVAFAQDSNTTTTEGENFWSQEKPDLSDSAKVAASLEPYEKPMPKALKNSCVPRKELREEARLLLRPFRYNLAKTTMITMQRYPQKFLLIIPIYAEESHRIVFSNRGMPQAYGIKIYDQHPEANKKKASVIFEADTAEAINTYELPADYENQYIFVEYTVPPTDAENRDFTEKGCAIMFMGYLYLPDGVDPSTVNTDEGTVGHKEDAKD